MTIVASFVKGKSTGEKNKSMYAILGILNLSPSTCYDIKKYSDNVLSGFWNENFGYIYPTFKGIRTACSDTKQEGINLLTCKI